MIDFKRKNKEIEINFVLDINSDTPRFEFNFNCGSQTYAELVTQKMQSQFTDMVKELKKEAYLIGRKDEKHHQRIKTFFYSNFSIGGGIGH